jgi:hypothetical protein
LHGGLTTSCTVVATGRLSQCPSSDGEWRSRHSPPRPEQCQWPADRVFKAADLVGNTLVDVPAYMIPGRTTRVRAVVGAAAASPITVKSMAAIVPRLGAGSQQSKQTCAREKQAEQLGHTLALLCDDARMRQPFRREERASGSWNLIVDCWAAARSRVLLRNFIV